MQFCKQLQITYSQKSNKLRFLFRGDFDQFGSLIRGQKVKLESVACSDGNGQPEIQYSQPLKPEVSYQYKPPTSDSLGDQPLIGDEIAEDYVYVENISKLKVWDCSKLKNILKCFVSGTRIDCKRGH